MKSRIFLFILFLSFFHCSFAENGEWMKGYIVTNASDTIRGELAYRDGNGDWKECVFRPSGETEQMTYSPNQIRAYGYDSGLSFLSQDVKLFKVRQRLFVQSLLLGMMDLYYLDIEKCTDFPNGYVAYIVRTPSGEMMDFSDPSKSGNRMIAKRQNRAKLNYLFADYPQLQPSIKKIDSDRDSWIALFQEYHAIICNEYTCTYYEEKSVPSRWFLTPYVVGNYYRANFRNYAFISQRSLMPGAGIVVTKSLSKFTDKNLFHIGLEFSGMSISSDEVSIRNFSTFTAMNYYTYENRFVFNKVAPLLELGLYHGLQFALKNETTYPGSIDYKKYYCGILIGTGVDFKVKGSWIPVKVQYRYAFGKTRAIENLTLEQTSSVSLSVGYRFKL